MIFYFYLWMYSFNDIIFLQRVYQHLTIVEKQKNIFLKR